MKTFGGETHKTDGETRARTEASINPQTVRSKNAGNKPLSLPWADSEGRQEGQTVRSKNREL